MFLRSESFMLPFSGEIKIRLLRLFFASCLVAIWRCILMLAMFTLPLWVSWKRKGKQMGKKRSNLCGRTWNGEHLSYIYTCIYNAFSFGFLFLSKIYLHVSFIVKIGFCFYYLCFVSHALLSNWIRQFVIYHWITLNLHNIPLVSHWVHMSASHNEWHTVNFLLN